MFEIENGILERYIEEDGITDVVIPNSVTTIGYGAFYGCSSLTSVIIPDSVTNIGYYAFNMCKNLTKVIIPDSVTTIGKYAFENCRRLASIVIPNSVATIRNGAFEYCGGLTSINIPNSITTIGDWVFAYCNTLTSVSVPDSITTIEQNAFYECDLLQSKNANYKAFNLENGNLVCRDYIFKDNEWSDTLNNIKPCKRGYHYCENLFEVFNYYWGEIDKDIAIYECEVGDEVIHTKTSKCCTNRIKPVKRLYREDIIKILNGGK